MSANKQHFQVLTAISVVLFLLSFLVYKYFPAHIISDFLLYIVPFFFLMGILSRIISSFAIKKDPKKGLAISLAISGIKLFIYLAVLIVYGFLNGDDAPAFFISFFVFYLIYTFTEVKLVLWEGAR